MITDLQYLSLKKRISSRITDLHIRDREGFIHGVVLRILEAIHVKPDLDVNTGVIRHKIFDEYRTLYGRTRNKESNNLRFTAENLDTEELAPPSSETDSIFECGPDVDTLIDSITNHKHKRIFLLHYLWGFDHYEIGKLYGFHYTYSCQVNKMIQRRLKKRYSNR